MPLTRPVLAPAALSGSGTEKRMHRVNPKTRRCLYLPLSFLRASGRPAVGDQPDPRSRPETSWAPRAWGAESVGCWLACVPLPTGPSPQWGRRGGGSEAPSESLANGFVFPSPPTLACSGSAGWKPASRGGWEMWFAGSAHPGGGPPGHLPQILGAEPSALCSWGALGGVQFWGPSRGPGGQRWEAEAGCRGQVWMGGVGPVRAGHTSGLGTRLRVGAGAAEQRVGGPGRSGSSLFHSGDVLYF